MLAALIVAGLAGCAAAPVPGDRPDAATAPDRESPRTPPAPKPAGPRDDGAAGVRVSAREYLFKGVGEAPGYGLYSYFLIPRPPQNAREVQRLEHLYRAYRTLPEARRLRESAPDVRTAQVNIAYWPLDANEVPAASDERFFVDRYDYARADTIRGLLRGLKPTGPYIVAARFPLGASQGVPEGEELLVVDLSRIDAALFADATGFFRTRVLDDPATWTRRFDWELLRIHLNSAIALHGQPVLHAATWIAGGFFRVGEALAAPGR